MQRSTLGNCANLVSNTVHPSEVPDSPYIGLEHIGKSSLQLVGYGTSNDVESAKSQFQTGDTLFGKLRPYFRKVVRAPFDGICSTDIWVVRANDGVDQGFIHYCLASQHFVNFVDSSSEGTRMPRATWKCASEYELKLPPLPEQRAIAHVLGTLDDKIELNQRMNRTLEAMARALFKSWFVDFDPVRAKMALKRQSAQTHHSPPPHPPYGSAAAAPPPGGSDEATSRSCTAGSSATPSQKGSDWTVERARACLDGMDAAIAELFPDRLIDSELGEIPQGWCTGVLDDAVKLISGGTPRTSVASFWNGDIPWYTAKDAPASHDVFVVETERTITQAGVDNSTTTVLPLQTTVISARGTVGRLACLGQPMAMNQTCYGIRGASGYRDFFTYWLVRMAVEELRSRTHGTIFDTITRQTFALVNLSLPPVSVAEAFEAAVTPIMQRILNNLRQSRATEGLRDTLLPKLISGEIRLRDAEKVMEAVT